MKSECFVWLTTTVGYIVAGKRNFGFTTFGLNGRRIFICMQPVCSSVLSMFRAIRKTLSTNTNIMKLQYFLYLTDIVG